MHDSGHPLHPSVWPAGKVCPIVHSYGEKNGHEPMGVCMIPRHLPQSIDVMFNIGLCMLIAES